jgi:Concanavalin A-like lectin/glucanases superfamily
VILLVGAACADQTIPATTNHGPTELDRPSAWYPLDQAPRVGRDRASATRPDALATNVEIVSDPERGSVAQFNGGALVLLPRVHRDFTVAFWLQTTQQGPKQMGWVVGPRLIDADYPGLALDFGVSLSLDKLAFGVGDPNDTPKDQTAMQSQRPVVDGLWHHVAVTRDGTTGLRQIFIDGTLDNEAPALPGELKLPPTVLVGQRIPTIPPSPILHAKLSDLRFFDRVVSAAAIAFLATQ